MTDKPKPPTLGDTERPVVPPHMARWLRQADAIRAARERGWGDDAVGAAGERAGAYPEEKPKQRPATHTKVPKLKPAEDDDADVD